jgi:hypothetical protein
MQKWPANLRHARHLYGQWVTALYAFHDVVRRSNRPRFDILAAYSHGWAVILDFRKILSL